MFSEFEMIEAMDATGPVNSLINSFVMLHLLILFLLVHNWQQSCPGRSLECVQAFMPIEYVYDLRLSAEPSPHNNLDAWF